MGTLVEFGKIAKPVTVLIEKISDATGVLYEPTKIRREAIAKADASKTKALMDLEIEDIQKRALNRLVKEEIKKQENIENITEKSFSSLDENATPENIENDWMSNFFDKCKLISDNEMQELWAQILAGEANNPGRFSKRTIEFMSTVDKNDAMLFDKFLNFCWYFGDAQPLIMNYENEIFEKYNISFNDLMHLDSIGVINFNLPHGFRKQSSIDEITIFYYGKQLILNLKNIHQNMISTGFVNLTKIGTDIAMVSHPNIFKLGKLGEEYIDDYYHYIVEELYKQKIILSEPLLNKDI
jgi:hypothetical protein